MVISNAIICDVNGERKSDIRIQNAKIVEFGDNLKDDYIIDAKGAYLLPALVDTNISLKDTQLNAKNIKSLSNEAIKGGIATVILNPNTTPAIDNEIVLEYAQNALNSLEGADIELTVNALQEDLTLSNIAILLKDGAVAPYMSTIAKNDVAIKVAQYAQMYNVTLFCKAEDNSLMQSGVMLDGDISSKLGLAGIPNLSEILHVSRMIEIAKHFNIKILFKAIASPRSIELISQAKKEGINVSCEVSINHLIFSDEDCEDFNTTAKLNPPLANKNDMQKLLKALQNSQIDMLTTLHQPNSPLNKEVAFYDAAYGSQAISYALSIYYTKLVKKGIISMSELVKLTVENPAKAIKKEMGTFKISQTFNAILFDINETTVVQNPQSLFNSEILNGKVTMFIKNDKVIQF